jgi:hypothetical protein
MYFEGGELGRGRLSEPPPFKFCNHKCAACGKHYNHDANDACDNRCKACRPAVKQKSSTVRFA